MERVETTILNLFKSSVHKSTTELNTVEVREIKEIINVNISDSVELSYKIKKPIFKVINRDRSSTCDTYDTAFSYNTKSNESNRKSSFIPYSNEGLLINKHILSEKEELNIHKIDTKIVIYNN